MRNLLTTSAVLGCLAAPLWAQSIDALVEDGLAAIRDGGGEISFAAREEGEDGSITLRDVILWPEGPDKGSMSTGFVTVLPVPGDPDSIEIRVADRIEIVSPDLDDATLETPGLSVVTTLPQDQIERHEVSVTADRLALIAPQLSGTRDDDINLENVTFSFEDPDFNFTFDMATRSLDGEMSSDVIAMDFDVADQTVDGDQSGSFRYQSFGLVVGARNLPDDPGDDAQMKRFLDVDGAFWVETERGPGQIEVEAVMDDGVPAKLSGRDGGGMTELALRDGVMQVMYDLNSVVYGITFESVLFPVPIAEISASNVSLGGSIPVRPSEDAQTMAFDFALRDVAVNDDVLDLIDVSGNLPRNPATLALDVEAELILKEPLYASIDGDGIDDIDDPTEIAEVTQVLLNNVVVSAFGAEVDGTGAISLQNEGPRPVPVGSLDWRMSGIQALADTVVGLGFADPTQVAMMKGMMNVFAVPVEGETDLFTTTIEFTEDGAITANGVPLQ